MTARPIRRNAQTPDRNGKIFYTSTTSLSHISKRMANVAYPISKQEILEQIGDEIVKVDMEHYLSVREIIAPIRQETFSCAAEFYCALLGA